MFPVFPVLFPVCSQLRASSLIVFPVFPVSAARAMSTVSCNPFLHAGNTGKWELDGNGRTFASGALEQTWNKRGTGGAAVDPFWCDSSPRLQTRAASQR